MTDYDETNSGVLFHEKEVKSERHPNMTGKLNVEGKEYRIAAWEKTSRSGDTFLSLAISEQKEQREANTDTGYEQAKAKAQEIKSRQVDTVVDMPEDDEPIDLSEIPF